MSLAVGTRLGPYEIVAPIGAGGMGEVYRAKDTRLDRDVAVKVLPASSVGDAEAEARFDREARAIAALSHPHICTLHDVGRLRISDASAGQGQDVSYLVMEFLEGETLHQRLTGEPMPVGELVDHAIALADALEVAHARGMLHRDLKPANLFLTSRGQIKILDFGLAKALAPPAPSAPADATRMAAGPQTSAGTVVGTMGYMSPEQLRGEEVDARSDLFSLGVVLYEMATGQRAFPGSTGAVVSSAILTAQPIAPSAIRPGLPPRLEETILKSLEKDRDVRCQSAAELRADLKRVKRDVPDVAAAPAAGLVQGHRTKVVVALVVAIASVAAVLWSMTRGSTTTSTTSSAALDIQPLTFTGDAAQGALSPDGKFVAYKRTINRQDSLWVRQLATHSDVQVMPAVVGRALSALVVTPDGNYVDFIVYESGIPQPSLWRVPLLGGAARRIADDVWSGTGWAPDGNHMAFIRATREVPEGDALVVADPDGGNQRVVATRLSPEHFLSYSFFTSPAARPSWSRDGRTLLVLGSSETRGTDLELVVVDVAAGKETKTVALNVRGIPGQALWLDDTHALVSGNTLDMPALARVDLATGVTERVTTSLTAFADVSLTADRQAAVTTQFTSRSGIWIGDADGGSMKEVVPDSAAAPNAVSLDRSGAMAYAMTSQNGTAIFTIKPGASSPSLVVDDGSAPQITRDGQAVLFRRHFRLFSARIDGSSVTALTPESPSTGSILPDDATVVFARNGAGQGTIWTVPLAGGTPTKLIDGVGMIGQSFEVSPDGKRLKFYAGIHQGRFMEGLCDLPACTNVRKVMVDGRNRWTPDGRGLAFVGVKDDANLWVQPIDGGPAHQLTKFSDKRIVDFRWSPDGSRLAVTRGTLSTDMVLIKGIR